MSDTAVERVMMAYREAHYGEEMGKELEQRIRTELEACAAEAVAALPCYWKWDDHTIKACPDEWPDGNEEFAGADGWGANGWCFTCTARQERG